MSFDSAFGPPADEQTEQDSRMALWLPGPGVLLSRVEGVYSAALVDTLLETLEEKLAGAPRILVCHDWLDVPSFDVAVQRRLTLWTTRNLDRSEKTHVGVRSPIIRMSVTVANVPLRGLITLHDSAATLVPAVEAAVRDHLAR